MQPQLTTRRHGVWWLVPTALGGLMLLLLIWCYGVLANRHRHPSFLSLRSSART